MIETIPTCLTKYLAFLRGINVGGNKLIKMKDLQQLFLSIGLLNVLTYINSGNVSFESESGNIKHLEITLKSYLEKRLGYEINVMIRTLTSIQNMVNGNPFKNCNIDGHTNFYVCFLESEPKNRLQLPLKNPKEGLEFFRLDSMEAYIVSNEINGRYGFPNNFLEKEIAVTTTARNWTTINKIVKQS